MRNAATLRRLAMVIIPIRLAPPSEGMIKLTLNAVGVQDVRVGYEFDVQGERKGRYRVVEIVGTTARAERMGDS